MNTEGIRILIPATLLGNRFYGLDELDNIRLMPDWRVVIFSKDAGTYSTITNGYIVPLRFKQLAEEIKLKAPSETAATRAPTKAKRIYLAILLVPAFAWVLLSRALRFYGFVLNPFVYASAWGAI